VEVFGRDGHKERAIEKKLTSHRAGDRWQWQRKSQTLAAKPSKLFAYFIRMV